jgi:hypothetical protein
LFIEQHSWFDVKQQQQQQQQQKQNHADKYVALEYVTYLSH